MTLQISVVTAVTVHDNEVTLIFFNVLQGETTFCRFWYSGRGSSIKFVSVTQRVGGYSFLGELTSYCCSQKSIVGHCKIKAIKFNSNFGPGKLVSQVSKNSRIFGVHVSTKTCVQQFSFF